jgi:hypothetical protein
VLVIVVDSMTTGTDFPLNTFLLLVSFRQYYVLMRSIVTDAV